MAISEIAVPAGRAGVLEGAFQSRLHLVDGRDGFLGLSVLRDRRHPGRYLMITRWTSKDVFRAYMRSADHDESHARTPAEARAAGFSDYDLVAT